MGVRLSRTPPGGGRSGLDVLHDELVKDPKQPHYMVGIATAIARRSTTVRRVRRIRRRHGCCTWTSSTRRYSVSCAGRSDRCASARACRRSSSDPQVLGAPSVQIRRTEEGHDDC